MAKGLPVDTDPDPSPDVGARTLRRYWTRGKGAAKIRWGTPNDWSRCVKHLRKYVGAGAEGLCNVYHTAAVGEPPGKGHKDLGVSFEQSNLAETAIKALLSELETKAPAKVMNSMDSGVSAGARNRALSDSRARMNHNDANARADAQKKRSKQRRIRTAAGARRYKGNIGDVITTQKVEKGDTLWDLAKQHYGDPRKWKLIAKANDIDDPRKLPIGKELVLPPDPDNPHGNQGTMRRTGNSTGSQRSNTSRTQTRGERRAEAARRDNETYSDRDHVDLEATYYAPKNMKIEDVLKKFYGNTDRLEDVLKVNGLKKGDQILAGQSLVLPGVDPDDVYPDKKKRDNAKRSADKRSQGRVPKSSPGGAKAKATSRGYTLYEDGSVYGAGGWIVNNTKKAAQKRSRAKNTK